MKRVGPLTLGCLLLWLPGFLYAYDVSDSLTINGFGTVGVSTNDRDDIRYKVRPDQTDSVGDGEFNFGINTIIGLQARYEFTDALSATAQGVLRYIDKDSWKGELDWAYLNYDTPWDFSVRAGKFRLPIFQSTELANVGYSRLYARPPLVFYGVGGLENLIGGQINYNRLIGDYELGLRATYGKSDDELPPGPSGRIKVESDDIKIVSAKIGNEQFWFNLAYTDLTVDQTRKESGRPSRFVGSSDVNMWSFEGHFELGGFELDGGYGKATEELPLPDEKVWYVSLSYPLGAWTPYVLYSGKQFGDIPSPVELRHDSRPPPPRPGGPPPPRPGGPPPPGSGGPPPPPDVSDLRDDIYSLGVRYDLQPGVALKFQWDHINSGIRGGLSDNQTGERGTHNAFSLVLDWMF